MGLFLTSFKVLVHYPLFLVLTLQMDPVILRPELRMECLDNFRFLTLLAWNLLTRTWCKICTIWMWQNTTQGRPFQLAVHITQRTSFEMVSRVISWLPALLSLHIKHSIDTRLCSIRFICRRAWRGASWKNGVYKVQRMSVVKKWPFKVCGVDGERWGRGGVLEPLKINS